MGANIEFWDLGSGLLNPGQSITWWWAPDAWGEIPVITVQALTGRPTEKQVEVTRVIHLARANNTREGRVTVSNTGGDYCFYRIRFAFLTES
jgi:hypothetical protein